MYYSTMFLISLFVAKIGVALWYCIPGRKELKAANNRSEAKLMDNQGKKLKAWEDFAPLDPYRTGVPTLKPKKPTTTQGAAPNPNPGAAASPPQTLWQKIKTFFGEDDATLERKKELQAFYDRKWAAKRAADRKEGRYVQYSDSEDEREAQWDWEQRVMKGLKRVKNQHYYE